RPTGSIPCALSTRPRRWAGRHEKMIMAVRSTSTDGQAWPAWYVVPRYAPSCSPDATYSGVRDASDEDDLDLRLRQSAMSDGVSDSRREWVRVRREQLHVVEPQPMNPQPMNPQRMNPQRMNTARIQTGCSADGLALLGGRMVHVTSRPGAGPSVVLLGGCAVPSYDWDLVADLLPELGL